MGALVQTAPRSAPTPPPPSSPRTPVSPRPRRKSGRIAGVPIRALTRLRAGDSPSQRRIVESGGQGPDPKAKKSCRHQIQPGSMEDETRQSLMRVGFRALALKKELSICSLTMPSSVCMCGGNRAPHASQRCGPCGANFFKQTDHDALAQTAPRSAPTPPPPSSSRTQEYPRSHRKSGRIAGVPIRALTSLSGDSPAERRIAESGG